MEQVAFAPPPLPPKTRRAPPESTVLANSAADAFGYSFPEVQEGHSQISSSSASTGNHVVKIRINPDEGVAVRGENGSVICDVNPCIRISVNSEDVIQTNSMPEASDRNNPYFYYNSFNCNVMTSGQISPSDTLDSGTCSDLDSAPPPLPKKKNAGVSVTLIGVQHKRASSLESSVADGDSDNDSNLSCDSLNSAELQAEQKMLTETFKQKDKASAFLPQGLLKDIRDRSTKLTQSPETIKNDDCEDEVVESLQKLTVSKNGLPKIVDENSYQSRKEKEIQEKDATIISELLNDTDKFYEFHLNEKNNTECQILKTDKTDDEYFAGYKDLLGNERGKTIRSAKGTVRGVKNRVRAGIATFLQIGTTTRNYKEKDAGKVVVYTTTMGIVRETYHSCMKVKQILRTLLVKYEERDVFMSGEYQAEIRDRMRCDHILVPQVFVDGQHVGDAETIERLNESGELRRILKPYKSMDVCTTCQSCGGYRLLPCPVCNGSKKSVHRNHFTTEFVALKCMNCDEVGLVRCSSC